MLRHGPGHPLWTRLFPLSPPFLRQTQSKRGKREKCLLQALINLSSYFFIAISNSVKIYSTSTGQIVSTLSGRTTAGEAGVSTGHSDKITALSLDPESPFQLITASLDGTLKIWDLLEATLLRTIQVGLPITHLCLHTAHPGCAFIACNRPSKKKPKADGAQTHFPAFETSKPTDSVLQRANPEMNPPYSRYFSPPNQASRSNLPKQPVTFKHVGPSQ